jgi:transcription initiation factor TFIID subunit 15
VLPPNSTAQVSSSATHTSPVKYLAFLSTTNIQDLGGSFTPSSPLDASKFAFFLGINNAGDGNGNVVAKVPNGLPKGFYRCCTMISNANHSPLQMPVAQRGSQDDCRYFSTGQGGGSQANGTPAAGTPAAPAAPPAEVSSAAAAPSAVASAPAQGGGRRGKGQRGQ